ncbi:chloride channel protein [Arthrobacter sp. zg-Y1219]|uniref:chloride channel protein n=1 Tax=Arthrobacter sp. zg-Y1219 TaxID=3049067 RepID=UPI0024C3E80D|nr:chloride channel protein [Arthrobacter sp. zg-Y1219]MDK1358670.1 chloride channel protein [Arthrobacter sp. zg-Y1219]
MSEPANDGTLEHNRVRTLVLLSVPAILIGVVAALVLFALDELSLLLQHLLRDNLPAAVGADPQGGWWIFGTLTLTGLGVGLIARRRRSPVRQTLPAACFRRHRGRHHDPAGRHPAAHHTAANGSPDGWDVLAGFVIAPLAAAFALVGVAAFTRVHRGFRRLRNPVLYTTLGGALLGVLGVIGGPSTLFKGAEESAELLAHRGDDSAWTLVLLAAVKLAALMIAAAAGFRGGRIFPAVFVGVAVGLAASALVPSAPVSLAVSAAVLGVVIAVARDGWMALFIAVVITGDVDVTAVLCLAVLPAWLVVTNARTCWRPTTAEAALVPKVSFARCGELGTSAAAPL